MNLRWYKEKDVYSDGDVEDDMIQYIMDNPPEEYGEVIKQNFSWPVYYHLTNKRQNLLNWYEFKEDASVLEIGCGLGAVTGLLCDKCRKVTAVELSKRRATAAQLRCREKDNLEIIVANLNDITFEEKYDYITLIGVLEYQGTYTDSENPYRDFLKKIRSLLKEDGKLLIAIENKYGLKYWCGAQEDHTGIPFDGINQYRFGGKGVQTFSREELKGLLKESGFSSSYFYYPLPDYKLPSVIYSEDYLPGNQSLENMTPYYIPSDHTLVAEESLIYKDLIENNVFEFFSNSFLVECAPQEETVERPIFALLNSLRQKEYRIGTVITSEKKVKKIPLQSYAHVQNHMSTMMQNTEQMQGHGLELLPYERKEGYLQTEFVDFPTLSDQLRQAAERKEEERFYKFCDRLLEQIENSSEEAAADQCIIFEFGLDTWKEDHGYGKILVNGYLDMIPRNCFMKEDTFCWFDQEWVLENVPAKFILFRGLMELYDSFPEIQERISFAKVLEHYDMIQKYEVFRLLNSLFISTVIDPHYVGNYVEERNPESCKNNILKLLNL